MTRPTTKTAQFKKLWLWKNFVDGRPEYWAFDNAFPVCMDGGDPQTLGEPCGYALLKPSRKGRTDISDEDVLRRVIAATPSVASDVGEAQTLMKFYGVSSLNELVAEQCRHIEKLQAKLPKTGDFRPQRVREG